MIGFGWSISPILEAAVGLPTPLKSFPQFYPWGNNFVLKYRCNGSLKILTFAPGMIQKLFRYSNI